MFCGSLPGKNKNKQGRLILEMSTHTEPSNNWGFLSFILFCAIFSDSFALDSWINKCLLTNLRQLGHILNMTWKSVTVSCIPLRGALKSPKNIGMSFPGFVCTDWLSNRLIHCELLFSSPCCVSGDCSIPAS